MGHHVRFPLVCMVALMLGGCHYVDNDHDHYIYTGDPDDLVYDVTLRALVDDEPTNIAYDGDTVYLQLIIDNRNNYYDYYYYDDWAVRFRILDVYGREVWRSTEHEQPVDDTYRFTIPPHGTLVVDSAWFQEDDDGVPVPFGPYDIYADQLGWLASGVVLPDMGPEPIDLIAAPPN